MASSLTIFVLPVGSKTAHAVVLPNLQPRVQKAKANKTFSANLSKIRFLEGKKTAARMTDFNRFTVV